MGSDSPESVSHDLSVWTQTLDVLVTSQSFEPAPPASDSLYVKRAVVVSGQSKGCLRAKGPDVCYGVAKQSLAAYLAACGSRLLGLRKGMGVGLRQKHPRISSSFILAVDRILFGQQLSTISRGAGT